MKLKKLILLICLICLVQNVFAIAGGATSGEIAFERTLNEMGYLNFSVDGPETSDCVDYNFILPTELDLTGNELFPIFSLNYELLPVRDGLSSINVSLNDSEIALIEANKAKCSETNCIERIFLTKDFLNNKTNILTVCPKTSNTITKINVLNSSIIGVYKTPLFKKEDFILSPESPVLVGKDLKVKISIKNSGSYPALVDLNYIKPIVEEKIEIRSFKVLTGETRWSGEIAAGETKKLEYFIQPAGALSATLPASIACYSNIFGERNCIVSNYPQIFVTEPGKKINGTIFTENETSRVNESTKLTVAVKNSGGKALTNVAVYLNVPNELILESEKSQNIASIQPQETKYLKYALVSQKAGVFNIDCKIAYQDAETNTATCNTVNIAFEEKTLNTPLIAIMLLALFGLGIYAYIHFSGAKREKRL